MKRKFSRGFTLIEMLVVIAIIAVLVAIIIPTVTAATTKAKAATDAANLRSILGEANAIYYSGNQDSAAAAAVTKGENVKSKTFPDAKLYLVYTVPGFIDVFFVEGGTYNAATGQLEGGTYYGLDYFVDVAEQGTSTRSTDAPNYPLGYNPVWHLLSDNSGNG